MEYHFLCHQLSHASDESARFGKERRAAIGKGGVKEMLRFELDTEREHGIAKIYPCPGVAKLKMFVYNAAVRLKLGLSKPAR